MKFEYVPVDKLSETFNELLQQAEDSPNGKQILSTCLGIGRFLMEKNRAYGDSALNPLRVFSKADPIEQIRVRIDDKLSRMSRGQLAGEDAELDMLGYLILLFTAQNKGA